MNYIIYGLMIAGFVTAALLGRRFIPVAACLASHGIARWIGAYNGCPGWFSSTYLGLLASVIPAVSIGACAFAVAGVEYTLLWASAFLIASAGGIVMAYHEDVVGIGLGVVWVVVAIGGLVALCWRRRALRLSGVPSILLIGLMPESVAWVAFGSGEMNAFYFGRAWTMMTLGLVIGLQARLILRRLSEGPDLDTAALDLLHEIYSPIDPSTQGAERSG